MIKTYIRNAVTELPRSAWAAFHEMGMSGVWLAFCVFVLRRLPFELRPRPTLILRNWHEAVNYLDNFVLNELRQDDVENLLRSEVGEVVEVGVNVGVTTRWWLDMNPALRVVGIDMMQEALDYTARRVTDVHGPERFVGISGAVGEKAGEIELAYDNPLEGTNSLDSASGAQRRRVEVNTLDAYLARTELKHPLLLKLDIEGYAGAALHGAAEVLKQVRWVVVEIHHSSELTTCAEVLAANGFHLRHFHGRTMWWSVDRKKA